MKKSIILIAEKFAITTTLVLHYNKSRELRVEGGTKGHFIL